jgi:hypothetical protein
MEISRRNKIAKSTEIKVASVSCNCGKNFYGENNKINMVFRLHKKICKESNKNSLNDFLEFHSDSLKHHSGVIYDKITNQYIHKDDINTFKQITKKLYIK